MNPFSIVRREILAFKEAFKAVEIPPEGDEVRPVDLPTDHQQSEFGAGFFDAVFDLVKFALAMFSLLLLKILPWALGALVTMIFIAASVWAWRYLFG